MIDLGVLKELQKTLEVSMKTAMASVPDEERAMLLKFQKDVMKITSSGMSFEEKTKKINAMKAEMLEKIKTDGNKDT